MSKKKLIASKHGAVWKLSAKDATLAKKPHFNGFACGHGVHGDIKYNRSREKRKALKQIRQEGASYGSFLFAAC